MRVNLKTIIISIKKKRNHKLAYLAVNSIVQIPPGSLEGFNVTFNQKRDKLTRLLVG